MQKRAETVAWTLQPAKQALARGDYSALRWEIDELLKVFRINLDPQSPSYRELGLAMLRAYVKAIEAIAQRGRFGLETLADAVNRIKYPGLDLSNVRWTVRGDRGA
jgi:hypothetical protein